MIFLGSPIYESIRFFMPEVEKQIEERIENTITHETLHYLVWKITNDVKITESLDNIGLYLEIGDGDALVEKLRKLKEESS